MARRLRRIAVALAAAAVASVAASGDSVSKAVSKAAPQAVCGKLLPPSNGAYFGAMYPREWIAEPTSIRRFERVTGRRVSFVPFAITWADRLVFPRDAVTALWRNGWIPLIRVLTFPTLAYDPNALPPPGPTPMSSFLTGAHDRVLREWAAAARATEIPIGVDLDYEMNNTPSPWSGTHDGGGTTTAYGDPAWPDGPERFRDAFRRIVQIFRQEGATNVTFFFHLGAVSGGYPPGGLPEWFQQYRFYYPGDEYVDWLGLSVYSLRHRLDGGNVSFEEMLATHRWPGVDYVGSYSEITALGSRPLALNEVGFFSMPSEEAKAAWVIDASTVIRSGRYPRIGAVTWWADDADGSPWNGDPTRSPTFLAGFRTAFNQSYFDAAPTFGGDCRPLAPRRVILRGRRLSWTAVPNAATYEVFRGSTRIGQTGGTTLRLRYTPRGPFRVRGVNIAGAGPAVIARRR